MHRTSPLAAAAAIAVVVALAACSSPDASTTDAAPDLPRIATVASYPALPSGVEQGLFDEAFDTDASSMPIEYVASGVDGVQAVASGHADIAIGGYDTAVLLGDTDLRIVGVSETSPDTHALLVGTDSDAESLEDLEGATIGGYSAALPAFLAMLLDDAGLGLDYFEYVQVPNDGGLAALASGAIDGWYTWDPFFAQAEIQDLARPIVTGEDFYLNPIVVVTTQAYIDDHGDALEAFLAGYADATEWVNANPEGARDYMAEATGMSPEAAEMTIERRDYDLVVPSQEAIDWMRSLGEAQIGLGTVTELPDLDVIVDPSPLESVLG